MFNIVITRRDNAKYKTSKLPKVKCTQQSTIHLQREKNNSDDDSHGLGACNIHYVLVALKHSLPKERIWCNRFCACYYCTDENSREKRALGTYTWVDAEELGFKPAFRPLGRRQESFVKEEWGGYYMIDTYYSACLRGRGRWIEEKRV